MGSQPTTLEWATVDDQGVPNRVSMYIDYDGLTETVSALTNGWLSYGGLIDPLVDGKITGGQILIPLQRDASWKSAPVSPGNNSNQVMNLNFGNANNQYATSILLPSYKESILLNKRPNVANTPLSTFIAAVIAGYASEMFPNSKGQDDLTNLIDAFLTTRKLKKNKAATLVEG